MKNFIVILLLAFSIVAKAQTTAQLNYSSSTLNVPGSILTAGVGLNLKAATGGHAGISSANGYRLILWNESVQNIIIGKNTTYATGQTNFGNSAPFTNVTSWFNDANAEIMSFTNTGKLGIGETTPTAVLHLKAGTATANTAPLKFTAGTVMGTPETGAMEFDGAHFYGSVGSTRYQLDQQTASPAGSNTQIQYNNSGALGASANFVYNGSGVVEVNNATNKLQIGPGGASTTGIGGGIGTATFAITGENSAVGTPTLSINNTSAGVATVVVITNIPTSSAGLPSGAIWSNAGVLTIVP